MKKIFVTIALMAFSANIFASNECLANGTREEIIECLKRLEEEKKSTKTIEQKIMNLVKQIKISL